MVAKFRTENAESSEEIKWCEHIYHITEKEDSHLDLDCTWASYFASMCSVKNERLPTLSALLPLFPDYSNSIAMLNHCIDFIRTSISHLNPNQIQSLLAINHCSRR